MYTYFHVIYHFSLYNNSTINHPIDCLHLSIDSLQTFFPNTPILFPFRNDQHAIVSEKRHVKKRLP